MHRGFVRLRVAAFAIGLAVTGCGGSGGSSPPAAPCDQACMDQIALLGFRETLKVVFNLTLQGNPVGAQDQTRACPFGGTVHVFGNATSNANQGTTDIQLTYVLSQCALMQQSTDPTQTYNLTITGTATETGTLSAQPSATTALIIQSDAMTIVGTVHDPPMNYQANACPLSLAQDGNQLSGTMCGRQVGVAL
jgi:hypothetical protein